MSMARIFAVLLVVFGLGTVSPYGRCDEAECKGSKCCGHDSECCEETKEIEESKDVDNPVVADNSENTPEDDVVAPTDDEDEEMFDMKEVAQFAQRIKEGDIDTTIQVVEKEEV